MRFACSWKLVSGNIPLGYTKAFSQESVDLANEQIDGFIPIMKKRGVEQVDRITVHPSLLDERPTVHLPDGLNPISTAGTPPRGLFLPLGEVLPVAYEKVYKFGGMLNCTTLGAYPEGKCEKYFPNQ